MKVATYNVNGVNGRLPRLLEWMAESRPDVVCLQELKCEQTAFPVAAISDAPLVATHSNAHAVCAHSRKCVSRSLKRA